MLTPRYAHDRGQFDHGWLKTAHTFSFGHYVDPRYNGFHSLRVLNDDRVAPGQGFGEHGHKDMEIITYVLSGALAHRDSLGNGAVLQTGQVQRMTAGSGIRHSEFNPSDVEPAHFYQIWIQPESRGLPASYEDRPPQWPALGETLTLASGDGRDQSPRIHQDAVISTTRLAAGQQQRITIPPGRAGWLQVLSGDVSVQSLRLETADGLAVEDEVEITVAANRESHWLWFDMK